MIEKNLSHFDMTATCCFHLNTNALVTGSHVFSCKAYQRCVAIFIGLLYFGTMFE